MEFTAQQAEEIERLVTWALSGYRHHAEFEDLRQEAILKVLEDLRSGRGTGLAFTTRVVCRARWAAGKYFQTRRCRPEDYAGKGRRLFEVQPLIDADPDGRWEAKLAARLDAAALAVALKARLPPDLWTAILLVDGRGLTQKEAAEVLSISGKMMMRRLAEARALARALLEEE